MTEHNQEQAQAFLQDVVKAFPSEPEYAKAVCSVEATFIADGILKPDVNKESARKYSSQCSERGIIPYSSLKWKFNREDFVPAELLLDDRFRVFYDSNEWADKVIRNILKGGKIHIHKVEQGGGDIDFEMFRGVFLDNLLEAGYHIRDLFWMTTTCRLPHSSLSMDNGRKLKLLLRGKMPNEEKAEATKWFYQLLSKYGWNSPHIIKTETTKDSYEVEIDIKTAQEISQTLSNQNKLALK